MGTVMRVFEVAEEKVTEGALVQALRLEGAGVEIPAILVGEKGRGRALGVLPVEGAAPGERVLAARLGQTRTGRPKLVAASLGEATTDEALVVFRTPIGFRGSNVHSGGPTGRYMCTICGHRWDPAGGDACPSCGREWSVQPEYAPFPGRVIVEGTIAQGTAGRMGSGQQLVATAPRGAWVHAKIEGRRYGRPHGYWYVYDGSRLLAAPEDQKDLLEEVLAGGGVA